MIELLTLAVGGVVFLFVMLAYCDYEQRKQNVGLFNLALQRRDSHSADRDEQLQFLRTITGMKLSADSNRLALKEAIRVLRAYPADTEIQLQFLTYLAALDLWFGLDRREATTEAIAVLQANVSNVNFHQQFLRYLQGGNWKGADRTEIYKSLLKLLAINSEPSVRQFVLEAARWHYAKTRADGRLTIYDEQAIQNDLLMHMGA